MQSRDGSREGPAMNGRLFFALLLSSVLARLILPFAGYNPDMDEWRAEADAFLQGKNVYAVTLCNRGPIWYMILGLIRAVAGLFSSGTFAFEWGVSAFCTLVDCALGY